MSQVIADSDEMRRFANALGVYINNIDEKTRTIASMFNRLGDTWKDEQHQRFEDSFNDLRTEVGAFKEKAGQYPDYLYQLANDLDRYRGR